MKQTRGKGPVQVGALFERYKKILKAPQGTVVREAEALILEIFGVALKESECLYAPQSRVLTFRVHGPLKSEIMMQKQKILQCLKQRLGEKSAPRDIL